MEAVSAASSIAGLINLADVVISHGLRYIKDAKDANNAITSLLTEVTSLWSTLKQVEYVMRQFQQAQLEFKIAVQPHNDLESANKTLSEIQICLHENLPSEAGNPLKSLGRRLLWPFKSSETKELTAKIERHKSAINLLVGTEGWLYSIKSSGELADAIAKCRDAFNVENITRERREMLRCFGDVDPRKNQYIAEDLRKDLSTGSWFLDGDDFGEWLNTDCSKLLVTGIPGAGKTVLISTIVQNLQTKMKSMSQDGNALAFFYCDYQDATTHDPWNILGTIIKQLALQSDLCVQELENFYKKHNPSGLISRFCKPLDLCRLIRRMSSQLDGATIIIIDALDEINDKRSEVIAILRSLNDSTISTESNIKTLFTSRDEVDITTCLSDYRCVSVAADTSDLQLYVKSEIQYRATKQPFLFRTPKVRDEVLEVLVAKAGGMFRWVSCQIDYLCTLQSDRERLGALEHLPPTLKGTYERILRQIPAAGQPLVRKAFQWIIFAKEPLSAASMMEALAISEDDEDFAEDAVIEENALLQWCSSLIRKTPRRVGFELAHFTVKEFLLSIDSVSSDELSQYRITENDSNILLARTCLTYLNFKTFEIGPAESVIDFIKKRLNYPFVSYASQYWDTHAFGNFKDTCIMEQARKLFLPAISGQFKFWNQCAMYFLKHPFDKVKVNDVSYNDYYGFGKNPALLFKSTTPLHWAACLALEELCEWLLPVSDPNRTSGLGTPLTCAVLGQSVLWWVAEESLSAQDDGSKEGEKEKKTEEKQARIDTLLEAAAENSDSNTSDRKWRSKNRMKTIDLLVKANAQVDCKPSGPSDRKLLELALCVGRNDPAVVTALLSGGAKLTTAALQYASKRKDEEHGTCPVEVLALIEGRTEDNLELCDQKAFHSLAADLRKEQHEPLTTGNVSMTRELLSADQKRAIASLLKKDAQHGVASGFASKLEKLHTGPDRRDYSADVQEAFCWSMICDWPQIVKIFLDQEVEIEPATLSAAIISDSADVIKSFIKRGNHASQTHLFLAIECGRLRILKFLIDDGIDLSKPDPGGDMPLHRALKPREESMRASYSRYDYQAANQLGIAELLLEHGADVAARNADGDTPLHLAAASGLGDVVEFLLNRNAPLDDENNKGDRPLTLTTIRDCDKAMELLLKADADINAQRLGVGRTALHYACHNYAPRCLQMLLDWKADTERLGTGGFPAINLAALRGRWDAVEKLIYFGVNINRRNDDGSTLLHHAIYSDKENIVKLLLERDPDIEAQDSEGKTALIIAATRCYMPILELLLKYNANINKQCNDIGGTALHYAVLNTSSKQIEAVRLLVCSGADLEIRGQDKQTALYMAAKEGKWHAVTELAGAGANVRFRDDVYSGRTTLLLAAQNGQSAVVELLLQKGADPLDKEPSKGTTALILACQNGDLASARILLQNGAEVDAKTENTGSTALLIAASDGRKNLVELLLKHGANVNARNSDKQQTVLMLATKNGDLATVECVLDHGAEINAQRKASIGHTALSFAVLGHHREVVELLLKRGANFHLEDSTGRTIAHQLARDGDLKTLEPFLSQKVNWMESEGAEFIFEEVRSKGVSALHLAAKYGNKDFIATLFDRQLITHVEPRCGSDLTPLHWAACAGQVETTQALLFRCASVDAVTSDTHKTALHYSAEAASLETVATLLSARASIDIRDTDKNTAEMLTHDSRILQVLQNERLKRDSPQTTTREPRHSLLIEADPLTLAKRLLRASEEGNIVLCRQLIANGADIEGGPDAKCSPLIKALKKGHDEVAKLLIDKGADLHRGACQKMGRVGYQALHFATFKGGLALVQWILSKNPRMSDRGVEPIHIAAIQDKTDCLTALLDHERRRGTGSVRRMLDVQIRCDKDLPQMCLRSKVYTTGSLATGTSLHLASWAGATETVKLLLRYGADADAVDGNSRTPLHQACEHAHLPVLKLLLEAGASVQSRDCDGYTPLSLAVKADSIEAIDLLLERKSDKDIQDRYGRTCTYLAIDSGGIQLQPKFLELGMDFNVPSYDGDTALHCALASGHPQLIQFGIDHAPVPDVPQKRHGSILNAACAFTSGSLVKVLLSRATKSDLEDYVNHFSPVYGTPLYAASYRGDVETVEALLNAGATIDAKGGPLGTAFDAACAMGRENIAVVLLRSGANLVTTNPEEPTLPFTSPFDSVRNVLSRYLEKGVSGLDDALETVSEPIIKATPAAADAAIEADAAVIRPENSTCSQRPSSAASNNSTAEAAHLSHITHLPTTPTSRGDNSAPRTTNQSDPSQTKTVSFATSTISSPMERKSSYSLLGPTTPTVLPIEPMSKKVPLHQRQFTLTGPPPKYMGEACAHALIDPGLTKNSTRELDTPTLSAFSEEAVITNLPSPTTTSPQENVVSHLTHVESTAENPHLKTTLVALTDSFISNTGSEISGLGSSHHPSQALLNGHAAPEAP